MMWWLWCWKTNNKLMIAFHYVRLSSIFYFTVTSLLKRWREEGISQSTMTFHIPMTTPSPVHRFLIVSDITSKFGPKIVRRSGTFSTPRFALLKGFIVCRLPGPFQAGNSFPFSIPSISNYHARKKHVQRLSSDKPTLVLWWCVSTN